MHTKRFNKFLKIYMGAISCGCNSTSTEFDNARGEEKIGRKYLNVIIYYDDTI